MTDKQMILGLIKVMGLNWNQVKEHFAKLRKEMQEGKAPLMDSFPEVFKMAYLFRTPIERETKVMESIIIDVLADREMDDRYYQFLAEDMQLYKEVDECVAGKEKAEVQRILDELRDDMEASGEFD